jgi:hypothetical protein
MKALVVRITVCISVYFLYIAGKFTPHRICMVIDPFLRMGNKNDNQTSPEQSPKSPNPEPVAPPPPAPANTAPAAPKAPVATKKTGTRLSMGTFLIGCVVFLVLLVGLAAVVMYMIIKNPDQYANIGLDRATVQKLLQTFTILFFGFLFFV